VSAQQPSEDGSVILRAREYPAVQSAYRAVNSCGTTASWAAGMSFEGVKMSDVERFAKDLENLVTYAQEFTSRVENACGHSFKWGVSEVLSSFRSLFDRFCPYSVGDRVKLKKDCRIDDRNHGWYGCRHFLVKGAVGTVTERGYADGNFVFFIEFDRETWINRDGNQVLVTAKHVFNFGENSIELE
jgi:hypothetical protein